VWCQDFLYLTTLSWGPKRSGDLKAAGSTLGTMPIVKAKHASNFLFTFTSKVASPKAIIANQPNPLGSCTSKLRWRRMLCSVRHASDHGVNAKVTFAITKDSFDLNVIFYLSLSSRRAAMNIVQEACSRPILCRDVFFRTCR